MRKIIFIVSAALILSACATSEPKTDITDLNLKTAQTEDGEKLYCKREAVTGTHIKTTTCLTKAEKDAAERNSEDYVNRLKRSPEYRSNEPPG